MWHVNATIADPMRLWPPRRTSPKETTVVTIETQGHGTKGSLGSGRRAATHNWSSVRGDEIRPEREPDR